MRLTARLVFFQVAEQARLRRSSAGRRRFGHVQLAGVSSARGAFQLGQHFAGPLQHLAGHAGQPGDVDAVALVGAAGGDLVQEDDLVLPLADQHVVVAQAGQRLGELGQLVVVRGEQGPAADLVVQVLGDRPGQRDAVVGAGAAADLVEDDQAARRWRC